MPERNLLPAVRNAKPDLRILLFEVTEKCNAACLQCGSRCDPSGEEKLKKEEILSVLQDVKEHFGTCVMVNVTGGEPLLRKDLFEIMGEAHRMGFDWGMVTNGSLVTDEIIEKMKASGMKTVTVSIDGLKETHEELRRLPGSFDRIIGGLRKLKTAAFLDCIQVTFTSNRKNYREFPELYDLLSEVGVDSIRTSFIDPIGRAKEHPELLLGKEEIRFLTDFVNEKNRSGPVPIEWGCCHFLSDRVKHRRFYCFAGIYAASILNNGDIFACPNIPRRSELIQGNIRTVRFSDVWKRRFSAFKDRVLPEKCRDCAYADDCQGDSVHSFDFDRKTPEFCFRDVFGTPEERYLEELGSRYGEVSFTEISGDVPAPSIYLEPEAFRELRTYFHFGERHPLSMFEQQMGLAGYRIGGDYVIRYVFPSAVNSLADDLARFTPETLPLSEQAVSILRRNLEESSDRDRYPSSDLRFLGFAHSHPAQSELQYSTGDEALHRRMVRKYGNYIGMLVNPEEETIGAYVGKEIVQGRLMIVEPGKGGNL